MASYEEAKECRGNDPEGIELMKILVKVHKKFKTLFKKPDKIPTRINNSLRRLLKYIYNL